MKANQAWTKVIGERDTAQAELAAKDKRLKEAEGLISCASIAFIERQSDESGTWDVCLECHGIAKPGEPVVHAGNCLVSRLNLFLTTPTNPDMVLVSEEDIGQAVMGLQEDWPILAARLKNTLGPKWKAALEKKP
jgi:hypothetical protein